MNYYKDVTNKWLKKANSNIKIISNAKYVIKNGKRYYVNKTNKIKHENIEVENAKWFINTFGEKLLFLPKINEDDNVSCADYKYYPNGKNKGYFLEEKETIGKSKSVFYHSLERKSRQANIFLIDCTNSNFNEDEIYERVDKVFKSYETQYVKTIIIKNKNKLFGVFERKNKR